MRNGLTLAAVSAAACFALACTDEDKSSPAVDDTDDSPIEDTSSATGDTTWYADVQPMLATHCTRCHHEGGLGPGDFTDPDIVMPLADAMLAAIDDGRMPPAASDPSCQPYEGSDILTLPSSARDTLAAWITGDKPMGSPEDATPTKVVSGELVEPDFLMPMPEPYAPTYGDDRNPGNEYRCFALDPGEAAGRYITSMAPTVDQESLVHHVVLFSVPKDELDERYTGPQGWDCIDGEGGSATDGMIAAWAPGMLPIEFPENTGLPVPEDSYLVLQMHYFANGGAEPGTADQSGYAFNLADSVSSVVYLAPLGNYSFRIPAGNAYHTVTDTFRNTYTDFTVLGMFPHMHKLGTRFNAKILHEDGAETCLVDGVYDFDNQMTYMFSDPPAFKTGDTVEYSCTWDNSEGTNQVTYGERTDEEMCFFFTFVKL